LLDCGHPICFSCLPSEVTESRSIRCHVCPTSDVLGKDFERICLEGKPLPSLRYLTQTSRASQRNPVRTMRSSEEKLRTMLGFEDFSDSVSEVRLN
jgi:hypothetical protein